MCRGEDGASGAERADDAPGSGRHGLRQGAVHLFAGGGCVSVPGGAVVAVSVCDRRTRADPTLLLRQCGVCELCAAGTVHGDRESRTRAAHSALGGRGRTGRHGGAAAGGSDGDGATQKCRGASVWNDQAVG